jgi:tetratricopeptide (TPR) repeat protein
MRARAARQLYTQALRLVQDAATYYFGRAACYQALGEWERAFYDCTAAIQLCADR